MGAADQVSPAADFWEHCNIVILIGYSHRRRGQDKTILSRRVGGVNKPSLT